MLLSVLRRRGTDACPNNVCRGARVSLACGSGRVRNDHLARSRAECVFRAGAVNMRGSILGISSIVRATGRFQYVSVVVSRTGTTLARGFVGRLRLVLGDDADSSEGS